MKTKVHVVEHDRWSGAKIIDSLEFDKYEDAYEYCKKINEVNVEVVVPDYYITAYIYS
jgi:hypothetical protein